MMIVMSFAVAAALAASPVTNAPTTAQVLPTRFEAGHFYAVPETTDGNILRLLVDTGGGGDGGMYWVSGTLAQQLHLKTSTCKMDGNDMPVGSLPKYKPGKGLPAPLPGPCGEALLINSKAVGNTGQLGADYLSGRVWTFNYPGQQLVLEAASWHADPAAHSSTLGFPRNKQGQLEGAFPRITIRVDGQALDMLLDTGATAHPTIAGAKASGTPTVAGTGATSYITTSVLERWHKAHPDWRVVEQGDDIAAPRFMARLIEVPKVEIAGWSVGPVWFTERPDPNFHDFMSSMMDKRVEGAVGANVFDHFVMTLDYPHSTAYFSCVRGCVAATPPPAP
ncbi:MAG: hypothetical protein WA777_09575 [Rhodanobacter sp.]